MSDLTSNPMVIGLIGAAIAMLVNTVWNRVIGRDVKSMPVQLAEINSKLAEINATLLVIKNNATRDRRDYEELKSYFWKHMEQHHGGLPATDHHSSHSLT